MSTWQFFVVQSAVSATADLSSEAKSEFAQINDSLEFCTGQFKQCWQTICLYKNQLVEPSLQVTHDLFTSGVLRWRKAESQLASLIARSNLLQETFAGDWPETLLDRIEDLETAIDSITLNRDVVAKKLFDSKKQQPNYGLMMSVLDAGMSFGEKADVEEVAKSFNKLDDSLGDLERQRIMLQRDLLLADFRPGRSIDISYYRAALNAVDQLHLAIRASIGALALLRTHRNSNTNPSASKAAIRLLSSPPPLWDSSGNKRATIIDNEILRAIDDISLESPLRLAQPYQFTKTLKANTSFFVTSGSSATNVEVWFQVNLDKSEQASLLEQQRVFSVPLGSAPLSDDFLEALRSLPKLISEKQQNAKSMLQKLGQVLSRNGIVYETTYNEPDAKIAFSTKRGFENRLWDYKLTGTDLPLASIRITLQSAPDDFLNLERQLSLVITGLNAILSGGKLPTGTSIGGMEMPNLWGSATLDLTQEQL